MNKYIAVLGMGRFGRYIAEQLSSYGADLLIADGDGETINQLSSLASSAVIADLTDANAIKALGLADMDIVVVTMGSSLEASIMCVMVAKELGVPRVIAKAASEQLKPHRTRIPGALTVHRIPVFVGPAPFRGGLNALADGMIGKALRRSGDAQQLAGGDLGLRMDAHDLEDAARERAGFIEDDAVGLREQLEIAAALDEDAAAARTADAGEE